MFKYTSTLWTLIFATVIVMANAEPLRFRTAAAQRRAPNRFLARQEAEVTEPVDAAPQPPADDPSQAAPYPAAGVTPAIPFDLPTETEAPLPDEVYGPPEEEEPTPDPTYGPPAETTTTTSVAPAATAAEGEIVSQNLIRPRQKSAQLRQRGLVRSQPILLKAVPVADAPGVVELVRAEPGVIYILK